MKRSFSVSLEHHFPFAGELVIAGSATDKKLSDVTDVIYQLNGYLMDLPFLGLL